MIAQNITLYNHNNGVYMIAFFGLVVIGLIVMLLIFMNSGKKRKE